MVGSGLNRPFSYITSVRNCAYRVVVWMRITFRAFRVPGMVRPQIPVQELSLITVLYQASTVPVCKVYCFQLVAEIGFFGSGIYRRLQGRIPGCCPVFLILKRLETSDCGPEVKKSRSKQQKGHCDTCGCGWYAAGRECRPRENCILVGGAAAVGKSGSICL